MKPNTKLKLALSTAILTLFLSVSCSQTTNNEKETQEKKQNRTTEIQTELEDDKNKVPDDQGNQQEADSTTANTETNDTESTPNPIVTNPTVESEEAEIEGKSKGDDSGDDAMYYCINQNLIGFGNSNLSNVIASSLEEAIQEVLSSGPSGSDSSNDPTNGISCQKIDIPIAVLEKVKERYQSDFPEKTSRLLVNGEKRSFSNGCLEVSTPGEICTFAFVDGYKVRVESNADGAVYHLNLDATMIRQASTFIVPQ